MIAQPALHAAVPDEPALSTLIRQMRWLLIGGLGAGLIWAATAPIESAAIAPAIVRAPDDRLALQHREGGTVAEVYVEEGQRVTAGMPILRLENASAEAVFASTQSRLDAAEAEVARLSAEHAGRDRLDFPETLTARAAEAEVATILEAQQSLFDLRRKAWDQRRAYNLQAVAQLKANIDSLEAQASAVEGQLSLLGEESKTAEALLDKGLERGSRALAIKSEMEALEGQKGDIRGQIAATREAISAQELALAKAEADDAAAIAADLAQALTDVAALSEERAARLDLKERLILRAPADGVILGLKLGRKGAVLAPGERIADIVPEGGGTVIEARLRPTDIDTVHPGQSARVRLLSFRSRTTPVVTGTIEYVAADVAADPVTQQNYYAMRIRVDTASVELAALGPLSPGMPTEVIVPTGERTFLGYLWQPIADGMTHALREE